MSDTNRVKRIIDNKNSMCLVEYVNGNTGYVHVDATTEAQRKAFVEMKQDELKDYQIKCGLI